MADRAPPVGYVGRALPRGVGVGELVAAATPDRYRVSAEFDPVAVTYPYATHVCRVEVDADTGEVRLGRYVIVEDCGSILNAMIVEGQTHGAAAQGIGGALLESLVYDADGQLVTGSFMDYLLPLTPERVQRAAARGTALGLCPA